jgi:UDP-N-acetylglucosamine 2-epimerase
MAPVIYELRRYSDQIEPVICVTAQHREMLDQILKWFEITPDYDLNLMQENQSLPQITTRVMTGISDLLEKTRPDIVLVQGDTTSAMVTALAAFYQRIPVGHIEAGLRTRDRYSPFPEEINRRQISVLSTYHFAPTVTAVKALQSEGIPPENIFHTGNTVIDALLMTAAKEIPSEIPFPSNGRKLILVTAHRRENFGRPLEQICFALRELARSHEDIEIVYPVHQNPNVYEPVSRLLKDEQRIELLPPLSYPEFVHLMARSYLILTDSGGIQEEAPSLGKPVLVLRDTTERPEAIEAGTAKLIGTERERIVDEVNVLLDSETAWRDMTSRINPFGDGRAAERIVGVLMKESR